MAAATDTQDIQATEPTVEQAQKGAHAIKRAIDGAVDQLQSRFKDIEKAVKSSVDQVQERFQQMTGDDGKKRLESLRTHLKFDKVEDLVARLRVRERAQEARDFVDEGVKLTEEAVERLGLARLADLDALKDGVDKLVKKLESVRKRANEAVAKKDFDALVKRVDALPVAKELEALVKRVEALEKQLAS
jgi:hypothetical protein